MNFSKFKILLFSFSFIFFLVSNFSYATSQVQSSVTFSDILISLFDLISSIWYILPIIAGKLLTNDLLYGSFLHIDNLLWKIWNFSRTIANFLIGFLFIYFVFKLLIYDKDLSGIKTNLPKIAIGAIIINASWIIIGVLIDISTILIAGFGSLPLSNSIVNGDVKVAAPKKIVFDSTKCNENEKGCFNGSYSIKAIGDNELSLKKLQSYETYISGPLFFMGANILGVTTSKEKLLNQAYDVSKHEFKHNGTAVKALIQIIIILLFTIPIIVLIVVNVVRIFWIWIYIAFSPLIFLDQIFGGKLGAKHKSFEFKNMIGLIFQPALVVLAFSISFIFIVALYGTLLKDSDTFKDKGKKNYANDVKKVFLLDNSDNGIVYIEGLGKMQDSNSKTEFIGGFFSYLIVSILIIVLLWNLIKLSFKSTEITSSISENIFNFSQDLAKSFKFIPTPVGAQSIGSIKKFGADVGQIPTKLTDKYTGELLKQFGSVPDISEKVKNSILEDLKLKSDSAFNTKLREGFTKSVKELEKYKDKNLIDSRKNAKEIIDAIGKNIIENKVNNEQIKTNFKQAKTYEEKLDIILKYQETIKSYLN